MAFLFNYTNSLAPIAGPLFHMFIIINMTCCPFLVPETFCKEYIPMDTGKFFYNITYKLA